MAKTGLVAHIVLGSSTLAAIEANLEDKADTSHWLFIQRGRTGVPPKKQRLSAETYRRSRRDHSFQPSPGSVRRIVVSLAKQVGHDPTDDQFISTHAFWNWHGYLLFDLGTLFDHGQAVLGHARARANQ